MDYVQNTECIWLSWKHLMATPTTGWTALLENSFNVLSEINVEKTIDHRINGVIDKVRLGAKFVGDFSLGTQVFFKVFHDTSNHHDNQEWQKTDDVGNRHREQHNGCPGNAHIVTGRSFTERLLRVAGGALVIVAILFWRHFCADRIRGNLFRWSVRIVQRAAIWGACDCFPNLSFLALPDNGTNFCVYHREKHQTQYKQQKQKSVIEGGVNRVPHWVVCGAVHALDPRDPELDRFLAKQETSGPRGENSNDNGDDANDFGFPHWYLPS